MAKRKPTKTTNSVSKRRRLAKEIMDDDLDFELADEKYKDPRIGQIVPPDFEGPIKRNDHITPVYPPPIPDPEETDKIPEEWLESQSDWVKKYPPPKANLIFRNKWAYLIEAMVGRENFRASHLIPLEVLCDMYVDYENLRKFLRVHGFTYDSHGRSGHQVKVYPQVPLLHKVQSQIRDYTVVLGIVPRKDKSTDSEAGRPEWD